MKKIILFLILGLGFSDSYAASIAALISNVRTTHAPLIVSLYDNPARFPKGTPLKTVHIDGSSSHLPVSFDNLAPGNYALIIYQDLNHNGKMDTGFFNIPVEPYAYSNNRPVLYGQPSFNETAITLGQGEQTLNIRLY